MEIGGTRQIIFPPGGAAAMPMVTGGVAGVRRAFVICASTGLCGICMIAAMSSIDRPWGHSLRLSQVLTSRPPKYIHPGARKKNNNVPLLSIDVRQVQGTITLVTLEVRQRG